MNELGQTIKQLRKSRGITQLDLALACETDNGNISRIERGLQEPSVDRLRKIAKALGVSVAEIWQLTEKSPASLEAIANTSASPRLTKNVPVISWVQAGRWTEIYQQDLDTLEYAPAPKNAGNQAFALTVKGDSMVSPHVGEKSYPPGVQIIVDPDVEAIPGKKIVASVNGHTEATFKLLVEDGGTQWLMPLNPQYDKIRVDESVVIVGVVIGTYRSE